MPSDHAEHVELPVVGALSELCELVLGRSDLYVRWSAGPDADRSGVSRDHLTGVVLPGLSASALAVEPWWGDRPIQVWVARRLYDYEHLQWRRREARPWVLVGDEEGRGPDNEPLVRLVEPVAWVAEKVAADARSVIDDLNGDWGPLDREGATADR